MKIGVSSPAFTLEPFLTTLEKVNKDFEHWEIVADIKQLLPDIVDDFKAYMPSYDLSISVHAPFNDINLASLNPKIREMAVGYLKSTIATADTLGLELVTFHPGHLCPSGVYAKEKVNKANLESLKDIYEFSSEYNVTLALENMPIKYWTLGNTAHEILKMIADKNMGMCFDIGHANITGEIDNFLKNIEKFYNVHIHDNNGRRDEHLVLGKGSIDIPSFIKALMAHKYSGDIIIESNSIMEGIESKRYLQNLLKN